MTVQAQTSTLEACGGFDCVCFSVNSNASGFPSSGIYNGYGGGQIEYNAHNWCGAVGDLAAIPFQQLPGLFLSLLPRANLRWDRSTAFAQVLLGGILTASGIGQTGPQNQFALPAGGGVDFNDPNIWLFGHYKRSTF